MSDQKKSGPEATPGATSEAASEATPGAAPEATPGATSGAASEDTADANGRCSEQASGEPSAAQIQDEAQDETQDVAAEDRDAVVEDLPIEARLAEAERRAEESHNDMLRAYADRDNMRKRTDKEVEKAKKYAIERFALELLEIKDNLERSLSDDEGADEDVLEGVRLTLKSFEQVFERFSITEVPAAGQPFDPERHQAMSTLKTAEHVPNTVIEVVQKGYLLSDRLLRPAMVVVAAAEDAREDAPKDAPEDAPAER